MIKISKYPVVYLIIYLYNYEGAVPSTSFRSCSTQLRYLYTFKVASAASLFKKKDKMELVNLGLVVQKPFNPNPRSLFLNFQGLFNADIQQNFTLEKVILQKQN